MAMWKQQTSSAPPNSWPEPTRPHVPSTEPGPPAASSPRLNAQQPRTDQTILTNGMTVRGEISGPDAIYVDGIIEGQINIPGERVTVGPNGMVAGTSNVPCITAREVVVMGAVRGDIVAIDRLEIRANGSIVGDVSTGRLKIEEGSHFQGAIEIHETPVEAQAPPVQAPQSDQYPMEEAEEFDVSHSRRDYAEAAF